MEHMQQRWSFISLSRTLQASSPNQMQSHLKKQPQELCNMELWRSVVRVEGVGNHARCGYLTSMGEGGVALKRHVCPSAGPPDKPASHAAHQGPAGNDV